MDLKKRYKLTIEDEAHLSTLLERRIPIIYIWLGIALLVVLLLLAAVTVLSLTPWGRPLPGSIAEAQRVEAQRTAMRMDSLSEAMKRDQAWISNFLTVTDTHRMPGDSARYATIAGAYNPDSLPDASPLESRFVSSMADRERFNISVLAPLDADGMAFAPVAAQAVITAATRREQEATLLLPNESPVQAIADGTVLAIYRYPNQGHTILVQHGRGFVSSTSHLGTPLVNTGDAVNAGQPLAFPPAPDARATRWVNIRIWHNGTALIPYDILPTEL